MKIGTIFTEEDYDKAFDFSVKNNCRIVEIEPENDIRRFKIVEIPQPTEEEKLIQTYKEEISKNEMLLSSTDWYCSRYVDNGTPIPEDIKEQRQNAREEIDILREKIIDLESKV